MTNRVLGLQRHRASRGDLGFRHQVLVNQHVTDGADLRVGVHLRVDGLLLRQVTGIRQVVHDLVQVHRNRLRHLESQTDTHSEQVARAEILHGVLARERFVGGLHRHRPPRTGALGMIREDREEDVRIQSSHIRIAGQIHDVVGEIRDAEVAVQAVKRRQEVLRHHVAALRAFQTRALVPRVHDEQDRQRQQHREPAAVQELRHRRDEEHQLDGEEHDGEHDRQHPLAVVPHVHRQQDRGGDHRDRQRKAVSRRNMLGIPEYAQHDERGRAQYPVDDGNVQLAAGARRIPHLKMGHPVEAGRL